MYPRNNASPPTVAVGSIYLIADGTIQTSGASVRVKTAGGAWGAGGGSLAYDATSGAIEYTPTQAETNGEWFMVAVYKASCTTACITIVTSAESTAGKVSLGSAQTASITGSLSGSVGSVTGAVGSVVGHTPQTGDSFARLGAPAGASIAADVAAILTTALTESYAADGAEGTAAQLLYMIQQSLHEFAISSTTRTVKKLDGSTTAATFTLDDATAPTSTTRAT